MTENYLPVPTGWALSSERINSLQQASIKKMVELAKGAHWIDVVVRYEGKEHRFQADWIKHLKETQP